MLSAVRSFALRRVTVAVAVCILLGIAVARCTGSGVVTSGPQISYTCCSAGITAKPYHSGQQLRLRWIEQDNTAAASSKHVAITLTAILVGPYSTVGALKAANGKGPDHARIIATAPRIVITKATASAPVSVLHIPAGTAHGLYNLQYTIGFGIGKGAGTESASTVITVR